MGNLLQRFAAIARDVDRKAPARQQLLQPKALGRVVFHNEQAVAGRGVGVRHQDS